MSFVLWNRYLRARSSLFSTTHIARAFPHTHQHSAIDQNSASSVAIKIVGGFLKDRGKKTNLIAQPAAALFI
jgi:hypothetical protein